MSESSMAVSAGALEAKQAQEKAYRKKGLFIALMSGFLYGGYTAFMTQGMATGIWGNLVRRRDNRLRADIHPQRHRSGD